MYNNSCDLRHFHEYVANSPDNHKKTVGILPLWMDHLENLFAK